MMRSIFESDSRTDLNGNISCAGRGAEKKNRLSMDKVLLACDSWDGINGLMSTGLIHGAWMCNPRPTIYIIRQVWRNGSWIFPSTKTSQTKVVHRHLKCIFATWNSLMRQCHYSLRVISLCCCDQLTDILSQNIRLIIECCSSVCCRSISYHYKWYTAQWIVLLY